MIHRSTLTAMGAHRERVHTASMSQLVQNMEIHIQMEDLILVRGRFRHVELTWGHVIMRGHVEQRFVIDRIETADLFD